MFQKAFRLDASLLGLNLALVNAGQVVTGPFAGPILDRWGRRAGMIAGSVFLLIATALQTTAKTGKSINKRQHGHLLIWLHRSATGSRSFFRRYMSWYRSRGRSSLGCGTCSPNKTWRLPRAFDLILAVHGSLGWSDCLVDL
jgi:MFS family permease